VHALVAQYAKDAEDGDATVAALYASADGRASAPGFKAAVQEYLDHLNLRVRRPSVDDLA
jgi:hypothetical protein